MTEVSVTQAPTLELRRVQVSFHRAFGQPARLRILHLSDPHFHASYEGWRLFLPWLERCDPDLVVVSGDLTEDDTGLRDCHEFLAALRSRHGSFVVLGNHDLFDYTLLDHIVPTHPMRATPRDPGPAVDLVRRAGAVYLGQGDTVLRIGDLKVYLAGADFDASRPYLARRVSAPPPDCHLSILVAHSPDLVFDPALPHFDLVFAGHTHGGQIRLPLLGPLLRNSRFSRRRTSGVFAHGSSVVSIARGIGESRRMPLRFRCPREAILIEAMAE